MAEVAKDILYQPGISFTNPGIVRISAPVRGNPWFYERQGVGPLASSSKLKRFEASGPLRRYKAVWNRSAKQRNLDKLGAYFHDVPTMDELGAAPPSTSPSTTTVRNPLGFLDNLFTHVEKGAEGVTNVLLQREVQKTAAAQASTLPYIPYLRNFGSGDNTMWWIAGLGAAAVGAYFLIRR